MNTCKNIQHHLSSGKYKLKAPGDTTTHPLEWLKLKGLIILTVGDNITTGVVKIADGNADDAITLENTLADFYKVKHIPNL